LEYKDYYKILGIERNATQEEIKKRYRKVARDCHPDTCKDDPNAEKRFKEIGEAYEVLKDPEKRKRYDDLGSNWQEGQSFRPPPGFDNIFSEEIFGRRGRPGGARTFHFDFGSGQAQPGEGGFSDFFESLFGDVNLDRQGPGHGPASKGSDLETSVEISIEEAHAGTSREIQLQGAGKAKRLNVRIPAGAYEGMKIRLAGQGNHGAAGAGDLYLNIRLSSNGKYKLEGNDIVEDLPISPWDAALGTTKEIQTPDGTYNLKIPPGISSGQRLRLKGRGLAHKGDFFVQIKIVMPRDLTSEEKRLFAELKKVSSFNP
jgi:curved DNA-binding protein